MYREQAFAYWKKTDNFTCVHGGREIKGKRRMSECVSVKESKSRRNEGRRRKGKTERREGERKKEMKK